MPSHESEEDHGTGVYCIENIITGADYVGATTTSFSQRWWRHRSQLRNNSHQNEALQRDWNTYGEEAFEFSVIERIERRYAIFQREKYWVRLRLRLCLPEENYNFGLPVVVNGVRYACVEEAAKVHGISRRAMASRLKKI